MIAVVALFVALGGTAIAVSRDSVGPKQIREGAVRSAEVKNNGIKGRDVSESTLEGVGQGAMMGRLEGLNDRFFVFGSPSGTSSATEFLGRVEYVSPVDGTASSLTVHVTNAMPQDAAGHGFYLMVNGKPSVLRCYITGGSQSRSDCTNTGSIRIQRGDRLAMLADRGPGEMPPTDALFGWQLTQ